MMMMISDCIVGLSGLAADIYYAWCYSGHNCNSIFYAWEVKNYFISYSFRLTTVIAIDRSIRMKYLNRYSTLMMKTKAYLILTLSAVLGLVQFSGIMYSHRITFELAFMIFHFICITFSCILYTITYCSIKHQVRDVHLSLRCNVPVHKTNDHFNTTDQSVRHNKHESAKESAETCNDLRRGKYHGLTDDKTSSHFQNIQNEGNGPSALGKASSENMLPEKSAQKNSPNSEDNVRRLKSSNVKMAGTVVGTHGAIIQIKAIRFKDETNASDSNGVTHPKRFDNDNGKAMLLITFTLILCYFPMFVVGILLFCGIDVDFAKTIASAFLLLSSTSNAVILTMFSREIRSVAKSLF